MKGRGGQRRESERDIVEEERRSDRDRDSEERNLEQELGQTAAERSRLSGTGGGQTQGQRGEGALTRQLAAARWQVV